MRRPHVYLHRSAVGLPLTRSRFGAACAAAAAMIAAVWAAAPQLVEAHNAVVLRLCAAVKLDPVLFHRVVVGRPLEVITVRPDAQMHPWTPAIAVAGAALALGVLALAYPLFRGLVVFMGTLIVLSVAGRAFDAPALQSIDTFAIVWTHTEMLVWLLLPSLTSFLFLVLQPSVPRGIMWMIGVEAFAIWWSALRLVAVLGFGHFTGTVLLLPAWFTAGILADVLYVVTFYAWSIHITVKRGPPR